MGKGKRKGKAQHARAPASDPLSAAGDDAPQSAEPIAETAEPPPPQAAPATAPAEELDPFGDKAPEGWQDVLVGAPASDAPGPASNDAPLGAASAAETAAQPPPEVHTVSAEELDDSLPEGWQEAPECMSPVLPPANVRAPEPEPPSAAENGARSVAVAAPAVERPPAPVSAVRAASADDGAAPAPGSLAASIAAAASFGELREALAPVHSWKYEPENEAGIARAMKYVPDDEVLAGFFVHSINEWRVAQPRVLVLSRTAYYRVAYNPKRGNIDHYHKTPLMQLKVVEKTPFGLKFFLDERDGHTGPRAFFGKLSGALGVVTGVRDEFEHKREYIPTLSIQRAEPSADEVVDVIGAAFGRAAELLKASAPDASFTPARVITSAQRKQIQAQRREDERLAVEAAERQVAERDLRAAMASASMSRDAGGLGRPLRRARRAVDVDQALITEAHDLKAELEEEKRERELQERLERERIEREGASAELAAAVEAATASRDTTVLYRPLRRAQRAVGVSAELIGAAEALRVLCEREAAERRRIEAERRAAERAAREAARLEELAARAQQAAAAAKAASAAAAGGSS